MSKPGTFLQLPKNCKPVAQTPNASKPDIKLGSGTLVVDTEFIPTAKSLFKSTLSTNELSAAPININFASMGTCTIAPLKSTREM